ncbi:unnamed protein product [Vitrella brassicaformis CCMP3155]|uniref:RING-type domain-containing protein n=1 Tax=Vitrella brassicaformis (strain CCMP3155) TaxID=1169540 RepID=A0A0G4EYY3_VITBC|nr:unnamed protein product [Vitrella brassicaformis CCMP3155]|eukprot:CEM04294.1 unnamed protein product [Vitrella brassicaformis CCMP3155]
MAGCSRSILIILLILIGALPAVLCGSCKLSPDVSDFHALAKAVDNFFTSDTRFFNMRQMDTSPAARHYHFLKDRLIAVMEAPAATRQMLISKLARRDAAGPHSLGRWAIEHFHADDRDVLLAADVISKLSMSKYPFNNMTMAEAKCVFANVERMCYDGEYGHPLVETAAFGLLAAAVTERDDLVVVVFQEHGNLTVRAAEILYDPLTALEKASAESFIAALSNTSHSSLVPPSWWHWLFSLAVDIAWDIFTPERDPPFVRLISLIMKSGQWLDPHALDLRGYTDSVIDAVLTYDDRKRQWAATYLLGFVVVSARSDWEVSDAVAGQLVGQRGRRTLKVMAGLLGDRPAKWAADYDLTGRVFHSLALHGYGKRVLDAGYIAASIGVMRDALAHPRAKGPHGTSLQAVVDTFNVLFSKDRQVFIKTAASSELPEVLAKCLLAIKRGEINQAKHVASTINIILNAFISYGDRQVQEGMWSNNRIAKTVQRVDSELLGSSYRHKEQEASLVAGKVWGGVLIAVCGIAGLWLWIVIDASAQGQGGGQTGPDVARSGRAGRIGRTSRTSHPTASLFDNQEQANRSQGRIAQLKNDIHDASDEKHSLSCRYEELSDAHRRAVERKKQLQEAIREMKDNTIPDLSTDVLASCETAADARAFGDKVKEEHERLDDLYDQISAAERTSVDSVGISIGAANSAGASTAATAETSSTSASSSHSREPSVSAEPPATEAQLRKTLQTLKGDIRKLESGIAAMRVNCDKVRASLQPLEQEHDKLVQEADKGLTVQRLAALSSSAAASAFKAEVKQRQQQLWALHTEATKLEGQLQEREAPPAADRGTCVLCLEKPPTVVYFPCKQQCACAGCHERWVRTHEAAKREKKRLERARRRVPDDVKRDAVLRCPSCRTAVEYASDLRGVRRTT